MTSAELVRLCMTNMPARDGGEGAAHALEKGQRS